MKQQYSAVVRTWNSQKTLGKTLQSLRMQQQPAREIIVVDSGSSDETIAIAGRFGARVVRYPEGTPFNYSKALNVGIAAANTEYILSISSHTVIPYKDTAARMLDALSREDVAGVYCATIALADEQNRLKRMRTATVFVEIDAKTFDGRNGLWNTCSLIKKCFWRSHAFDESIWAAEDQEWAAWHYRHGNLKTVRFEGSGALDLNPKRSKWKSARDHVAVASRCYGDYYKWTTILKRFLNAARALAGSNRELFKHELLHASTLSLHRIGLLKFESQYHAGPPRWLAWLAR